MTDTLEIFRYEYVSGVVSVASVENAFFWGHVTNRGVDPGYARLVLVNGAGETVIDTGNVEVPTGPAVVYLGPIEEGFEPADYYLRIFTTSLDFVPSVRVHSPADPLSDIPVPTDAYFAPNVFARFGLPVRAVLPIPPIGPIE
ncbi:MAG TPA: hypothetical protein VMJ65_11130 [Solirubrobacteraceae bacterium]|nr:hypothetical protein [Solirubrobacteraceae bacterium]